MYDTSTNPISNVQNSIVMVSNISGTVVYEQYASAMYILCFMKCTNNTFLNTFGNLCENCTISDCITCLNLTVCSICNTTFYWNSTLTICASCPAACTNCTNSTFCLACLSNNTYYLGTNNTCLLCTSAMPDCLECTSSSACITCLTNQNRVNSTYQC